MGNLPTTVIVHPAACYSGPHSQWETPTDASVEVPYNRVTRATRLSPS